MSFHRKSIGLEVHVPHTFTYADAATRAAAVSTDFTDPDDLFKLARQTSDTTYWVLEQITPSVVWNQLGGGGGASELPFTSAADPAVDAAVTTAIIDLNSGTVITLTAVGNSQTLQAPTDTTAGRKFFVLNNNTSNNTVPVNGVTLSPGQYVEFRWDGDTWLLTAGGLAAGAGGLNTQIQYNDNGSLNGDPNHTWDDVNKKEIVLGDIEQVGGIPGNLYTPTVVATLALGAAPRNSVALGNYVFVVDSTAADLKIFDVSDPANTSNIPVGTVQLSVGASGRALDVVGNFAYVVDAANNVAYVLDISDPTTPVLISTALAIGQNPVSISTVGRFGYVTDNTDDNLQVIDFGGIETQNLNVGNIDVGDLNVRRDVKAAGNLNANAAVLGAGGIFSDGEVVAKGRALGGASKNVVEIFQEADFPDVGGLIKPAPGVTYQVMQPITLTKKIAHPTTVSGFDPAVIRTDAKYANIVTVNVASGSLLETAAGSGQLVFQNIRFESDGVVPFAIVSGATQTSLLTELDDCDIVDFAVGSTFTTCIFNVNNASFWTGSGTFKLVDCECNIIDAFNANFVDTTLPALRVQSSAPGAGTKSFLAVRNSKLSSQANEAFFMLHSNLVAGSTIRLTGVEVSPFTPGTGAFFDTETGSITALQDSGGAPGVRTVVFSAGHTVADGDTVVQTGFTSATQLNGTFVASDVTVNSYEVVAVFSVTDTGTWSNSSLDESSGLVNAFDNPGQEESRAIGSMYVSNNTDVTVIATIDTWTDLDLGTALAASNISAWTLTNATTGELTYQGNEPFSGTVFASISAFGSGGTSEYRFRAVKNGIVLPDAVETVIDVGSAAATASLVVPVSVVNGDTARLQVKNVDNTSDITVTHASKSVQ